MSTPSPHGDTDPAWITLDQGVIYSRAWLSMHTPGLFTAWQHASSAQQRQRLVAQIQQAAASAESTDSRDRHEDLVTIRWAETTRYEAQAHLDPDSTGEQIWNTIADLPDDARRTLPITGADNRIISVLDEHGQEIVGRWKSPANHRQTFGWDPLDADTLDPEPSDPDRTDLTDWGDVADGIDERIAESPSWPALNTALTAAAAGGYDVAAELPRLADREPLPTRDPAGQLHYRLINAGPAAAIAHDSIDSHHIAPTGRDEPPRPISTSNRTAGPGR